MEEKHIPDMNRGDAEHRTTEQRKYLLFAGIILIILLPFFQKITHLIPEYPLEGKQTTAAKPEWSWDNWTSGRYQEEAGWYYTQEAGFRSWMVRTNDQLYFSLYRRSKANDITIGKNNYLFSNQEVREYTTREFGLPVQMDGLTDSLLFVQKHLEDDGKKFLFVIAPNKVSVYPEFLPAGSPSAEPVTRFRVIASQARDKNIHLLDLTVWYRDLRTRVPWPLFTRGGMHWSVIGQAYAADTFFHALAASLGTPLPDLHIDTVSWSPVPLFQDNDLALGMNLLFTPDVDSVPYPLVSFTGTPSQRVLTIGDSFYDHMFGEHSGKAFQKSSYWFYFGDFCTLGTGMRPGSTVNLGDEINQHDAIVLFTCHNNAEILTRLFVKQFYGWYSSPAYHQWKVNEIMGRMRVDDAWMVSLREKAAGKGVPLDTMMRWDAEYILEHQK